MRGTFDDFVQLINDGQFNGYQVCFESSNLVKEGWTAEDYIKHLCNLERYKQGSGITIEYDFYKDASNRVVSVDVLVHYPKKDGNPEKNDMFHWVVIDK